MRYTLLIFALSLCTAFTQEVVKEGLLDPITITATRFNELISDVPYSVDLIEDRDILEDSLGAFPLCLHRIPESKFRKQLMEKGHHLLEGLQGLETFFSLMAFALIMPLFEKDLISIGVPWIL